MATKYYGIRDNWTDDDLANVIEVASEDGAVSSVKVNGEEYGGGGGGGDLTTAEVTLILDSGDIASISGVFIDNNILQGESAVVDSDSPTHVFAFVLYQGKQYANLNTGTAKSTTGSVVYDNDRERYEITGNCSITLTGESI